MRNNNALVSQLQYKLDYKLTGSRISSTVNPSILDPRDLDLPSFEIAIGVISIMIIRGIARKSRS